MVDYQYNYSEKNKKYVFEDNYLYYDLDGNQLENYSLQPFSGAILIKTYKNGVSYDAETQNSAPIVNNGEFIINNSYSNNDVVINLKAFDEDGEITSYIIDAGNINNAFGVNNEGQLFVQNNDVLNDYTEFKLTISVSDNGDPVLSATANIKIIVNRIQNSPPIIRLSVQGDEKK